MAELITLYGRPGAGADARPGRQNIVEWDAEEAEAGNSFTQAEPDFTVWRDRSLYLMARRGEMIDELRRRGRDRILIADGAAFISVRKGTSEISRAAHEAWGAVKGAASAAAAPVSTMVTIQKHTSGLLNHIANVPLGIAAMVARNPWANADTRMDMHRARERGKLLDAVVEVSCAASNRHRNAFNAAAQAHGRPGVSSNSFLLLAELADRLRREHGFS